MVFIKINGPKKSSSLPDQDDPFVKSRLSPMMLKFLVGFGCLGLLLVLVIFLSINFYDEKEGIDRARCGNQMRSIAMALSIYEMNCRSFLPAYSVDENGKPLHSWRVHILPELQQRVLYEQIALDEPWDSPYNQQFHKLMPSIYRCPASPESASTGLTSYMYIIGPETLSNGPNSAKRSDIINDRSDIMMLIEVKPSVNWMAPVDVFEPELALGINHSPDYGIGSYHKRKVGAAYLDCSIRYIEQGDVSIATAAQIRTPGAGTMQGSANE